MMCYPPFNQVLNLVSPQHNSTFAYYDNINATFALRLATIFLLFVYVYATFSLGAKCSNLTNRGVVSNGVYRIVRHPAYISKVLFWWVLLLPYIQEDFQYSLSLIIWTGIYFARAITDERHLITDNKYSEYCKKV